MENQVITGSYYLLSTALQEGFCPFLEEETVQKISPIKNTMCLI